MRVLEQILLMLIGVILAHADIVSGTPYVLNTVAQALVAMTFVVTFTTIIIAVISRVVLTDAQASSKSAQGIDEQLGRA